MHKASAGYDKESSIEYVHDYPDHTDLQSPSAINCECEHVAVTGDWCDVFIGVKLIPKKIQRKMA